MFKFFKKKEPIRAFESNADKFNTEQIWEFMKNQTATCDFLPANKSCEYIEYLISRLRDENDIKICEDNTKNDVRVIQLAISRNEMLDYVAISYQLFNPNVVYITTNPYFFAGDRNSFILYSNRITIHHAQQISLPFPMISIGCRNYGPEETGLVSQPGYTVRTCIPLLGNNQDYTNILTGVKALPIYGYDLRDGYHNEIEQPYASKTSRINIQLEKLFKIHEFNSIRDLYNAETGLYGGEPFNRLSTDKGAAVSNPYLQYLNFTYSSKRIILMDDGNESLHIHMEPNQFGQLKQTGNTELITYSTFPTLYSVLSTYKLNKEEINLEKLWNYIEGINSHEISHNPHEYMLFNAYVDLDDIVTLQLSMTQCIPNEIDAQVIAMQIVDYFHKIGESIEFFKP